MLYRVIKLVVRVALGLFYRLQVVRRALDLSGPVILVGNHPNSLVDPALVFVITDRHVTFLAREPLFRAPVLGAVLKGIGALPVYRKQDHPGLMEKNQGTLDAAAAALAEQRAITIFPEGKSHSEPELAEIKTGCARIALKAAKGGVLPRVVPVGLTYARKHRFRSRVLIEVGAPIPVPAAPAGGEAQEADWVRAMTARIEEGLRGVTLNLDEWADLPLIQTAEQLYSLRLGEADKDPERLRRFARGVELFRREQPERFLALREDVLGFRKRLEMVRADPKDLSLQYRSGGVALFVLKNLGALVFGFPLFVLGTVLFSPPFLLVRYTARIVRLPKDRVATLKVVGALVLTPLWQALLCGLGYLAWDKTGAVVALAAGLPLAIFTRVFLERLRNTLRDVLTFFHLGSRTRLKASLLLEGERLADQVEAVASEFKPRVVQEEPQAAPGSA